MALVIGTQALPDPPTFVEFTAPPHLVGGFFQITGNAARVELLYGRYGAGERLPQTVLPPGSYSVGRSPSGQPLAGIRAQNATAGVGATISGYFWTLSEPSLSFIGIPSSQVVGAIVIPRYTVAQFQALTGIADQQVVIVVVDATNGVEWMFQWDASSSFWRFIGGPPLTAEVEPRQTRTSNVFGDLTTFGPAVTLPFTNGDYIIGIGGHLDSASGPAGSNSAVMSFAIGATPASDADAVAFTQGGPVTNAGGAGVWTERRKTGLGPVTLAAKYRSTDNATAAGFQRRRMSVIPVRIQP